MSNSELYPIPAAWQWSHIAELGKVVSGGTPSTKEPEYWGSAINWISPADLSGYKGKFIEKGAKSLSQKGLDSSSATLMPAGSILFSSRAPVGYVAIASAGLSTNQGFKSLIPAKPLNNEYLYYYLKSAKHLAEERATGTTFKELSGKNFSLLPVPLPPVNEQTRIVKKIEEMFSELDKGVESLKTAQQQLKVYRQALLKQAFEGKLTEQWRADNPDKVESAEQLLERIKTEREARHQQQLEEWKQAVKEWEATGKEGKKPVKPKKLKELEPQSEKELAKLPELPNGWVWTYSENISDFITKGTTPKKNELFAGSGEVPFLKVYNLTHNGSLDFTVDPTFVNQDTHTGFLARSVVYPGDILMNIVGPPLGKVSLVPDDYPEWNINQAIARFRTYNKVLSTKFMCNYLLADNTIRMISAKAKATAGQFNLTLEICREFAVPICSLDEQREIAEIIDSKVSVLNQLETDLSVNLRKSEALRQSILKKAFSGQLVNQNPDDEPASELLARIRQKRKAAELAAKEAKKAAKKNAPKRSRKTKVSAA